MDVHDNTLYPTGWVFIIHPVFLFFLCIFLLTALSTKPANGRETTFSVVSENNSLSAITFEDFGRERSDKEQSLMLSVDFSGLSSSPQFNLIPTSTGSDLTVYRIINPAWEYSPPCDGIRQAIQPVISYEVIGANGAQDVFSCQDDNSSLSVRIVPLPILVAHKKGCVIYSGGVDLFFDLSDVRITGKYEAKLRITIKPGE